MLKKRRGCRIRRCRTALKHSSVKDVCCMQFGPASVRQPLRILRGAAGTLVVKFDGLDEAFVSCVARQELSWSSSTVLTKPSYLARRGWNADAFLNYQCWESCIISVGNPVSVRSADPAPAAAHPRALQPHPHAEDRDGRHNTQASLPPGRSPALF